MGKKASGELMGKKIPQNQFGFLPCKMREGES